jgi:hypothetical protein
MGGWLVGYVCSDEDPLPLLSELFVYFVVSCLVLFYLAGW